VVGLRPAPVRALFLGFAGTLGGGGDPRLSGHVIGHVICHVIPLLSLVCCASLLFPVAGVVQYLSGDAHCTPPSLHAFINERLSLLPHRHC
jgi:hypothetical protein